MKYDPEFKNYLLQQVNHWLFAASRLEQLDSFASPNAWSALDNYIGLSVQQKMQTAIKKLVEQGKILRATLLGAHTSDQIQQVRPKLLDYRATYLRTELTLDFLGDAINSRTNPETAALLRGCDFLATKSMMELLDQLGKATPPVLSYLDKGLGASILKAGLRLWDGGTLNPVAAIKIVRHNLLRPTSLIHEAGHQVAHIIGWNEELAANLSTGLADQGTEIAEIWASWASEIAADAFAFVHTGYAAVAALHDVLSGGDELVFRFTMGDPHPISYIRILLGIAMCSRFFGGGPWDELCQAWQGCYPLLKAPMGVQEILKKSQPLLPKIIELTFEKQYQAFAGKSLIKYLDTNKVKPDALAQLEKEGGASLFASHHWIWKEALRLLALSGLKLATIHEKSQEILKQQEEWMTKLGNLSKAA